MGRAEELEKGEERAHGRVCSYTQPWGSHGQSTPALASPACTPRAAQIQPVLVSAAHLVPVKSATQGGEGFLPPRYSVQRGGGKTAFLRHGCPSLHLPAWKAARSSSCLPAHIWREPSPRWAHCTRHCCSVQAPVPQAHTHPGSHSCHHNSIVLSHYFQPVGLSNAFILARNQADESGLQQAGMLWSKEGCSCLRMSRGSAFMENTPNADIRSS